MARRTTRRSPSPLPECRGEAASIVQPPTLSYGGPYGTTYAERWREQIWVQQSAHDRNAQPRAVEPVKFERIELPSPAAQTRHSNPSALTPHALSRNSGSTCLCCIICQVRCPGIPRLLETEADGPSELAQRARAACSKPPVHHSYGVVDGMTDAPTCGTPYVKRRTGT